MKCVACGCSTRGKRVGPTLYAICDQCDRRDATPHAPTPSAADARIGSTVPDYRINPMPTDA